MEESDKPPYLSLNMIGEYSEATKARKRSIISNQKKPKKFIFARYSSAKSAIKNFFAQDEFEPLCVKAKINELAKKVCSTDFQVNNRNCQIQALESFLTTNLDSSLKKFTFERFRSKLKSISIHGLTIGISPDLVIRGEINGQKVVGAIKLHFSKSGVFKGSAGRVAATGLYRFMNDIVATEREVVIPSLCIVLDVFEQKTYQAPENIDFYMKKFINACDEIMDIWDNVA
ncbi:hypothetical protein BZG01_20340 [Labilibaculum manganireducens]|uniref:Restriction endonuclease n=1 Tax=Labilibaculum manganireducens TaxID=1940525 RepID=A0A2N3HS10_9BACT|nr:hypothetical protein [Labilibaculum manganireducens]PKQ60817.1 hypothetical protein BZG01_20340 [Labilibaculum manganireducens]